MFRDRTDAGRRLATRLSPLAGEHPVICAIPRGGVPVGAEVAAMLGAPLDVVIVRKLGVPWHPELGFGAIGEERALVLNGRLVADLSLRSDEIDDVVAAETDELRRQAAAYRDGRPPIDVTGRSVVVVDDGIATGSTVLAAIGVLRRRGAHRVIVAAPVAPPSVVPELREVADDVIVLDEEPGFMAVGQFYDAFEQTTDDEVRAVLTAAGAAEEAEREVELPIELADATLVGDLGLPAEPSGVIVFAHGSGSSRRSVRNRSVAASLRRNGSATLLFDLLTPSEADDRRNVFDIDLLAHRLVDTTLWLRERHVAHDLPLGYFGASTGAAAALAAAAELGDGIAAIVSRGGRPDLAEPKLGAVTAPTLLIVGGADTLVLEFNRAARRHLGCPSELAVIPGATHMFEEPGALDEVARLASDWFARQFDARRHARIGAASAGRG